jgi:putative oxidoreductase
MNLLSSQNKDSQLNAALLILRVSIGALMLVHGLPKLMSLFASGPVQFPSVFGFGAGLSLGLTVFAEVFCSVLLILGFGTRLAAIPLVITMLVAVFYVHGNDPFGKQEIGLLYLLPYLVLLIAGPGKYSVDRFLWKRKRTAELVAVIGGREKKMHAN